MVVAPCKRMIGSEDTHNFEHANTKESRFDIISLL